MDTELKVLRRDTMDTWYRGLMRAFGGFDESPDERALWEDLTEFERSIGAWDGDLCVGTAGAFSFKLSVPGALTYRRRA